VRHIKPISSESDFLRERLHDNARLVLRPDLRLRREAHFVSLWRLGDDAAVYDFARLDPSTAVMLGLFDGRRTVAQVLAAFSRVSRVPEPRVRDSLVQFLAEDPTRLVAAEEMPEEQRGRYDPRSFVIPLADVDLTVKRPNAPMSLMWMITNACPANCVYCFAERQRHGEGGAPMSLARIIELLDEAARLGVVGAMVEGGDPFLHPHIVEIVGAMIARGMHVAISTKCELSDDTVTRSIEAGLRRLQVSIDTVDEETHVALTRAPGLLHGTLATVRRAVAAGFDQIIVNAVVTAYNFRQMRSLVGELASLGVTTVHFADYTRSIYVHHDDLFLTADEIKEVANTAQELQDEFPDITVRFDREEVRPFADRALCTAGLFSLTIHPDGKVVLCEQAPSDGPAVVGDLSTQSLVEVWNSEAIPRFLHPDRSWFGGTACETCPDFDECHTGLGRCFIKSMKAFGVLFGPEPDCPRAPRPRPPVRSGEIHARLVH